MNELIKVLKDNIRQYAMYIGLLIIVIFFTISTDGIFISSRNIYNIMNQTGYIAVLAVGITLVIIIKHIDLSIGYMCGFIGAVIANLLLMGVPLLITILIAVFLGVVFGLFNGFFVAKIKIPAFVATLGGMLIYRGLLLRATQSAGTINVKNDTFNAIGNSFIPNFTGITFGSVTNFTSILFGIVLILFFIYNENKTRKEKLKYGFDVSSMNIFVLKLIFISVMITYLSYKLSQYNGISWTLFIVLIVTAVMHFVMTKTVLGRHIYAVGGNPEAAELSGISVEKITYIVFAIMGVLAALAGILYTARLSAATPTAGNMFELDSIAAAYVGGVSANGGVGRVTNSVIGAIFIACLINGMDLMQIDVSYQLIIKGLVLVLAVTFDVLTRSKMK